MEQSEATLNIDSGVNVIKFSATWCGPCRKMAPTVENLKKEFEAVNFVEVDIDEDPDLALKYEIRALPTMVFTKNGKEIQRVTGMSLIGPLRTILNTITAEKPLDIAI